MPGQRLFEPTCAAIHLCKVEYHYRVPSPSDDNQIGF